MVLFINPNNEAKFIKIPDDKVEAVKRGIELGKPLKIGGQLITDIVGLIDDELARQWVEFIAPSSRPGWDALRANVAYYKKYGSWPS